MALQGNPIGAIISIIVSIALYFVKMALSNLGYSSGTKLITTLGDKINLLTDAASVMGLMVVGTLIATVIKIYVPFTFKAGEVSLSLQTDVIDKIMPLLPVLLTALVYWLLGKKWWTPVKVILLLVVVSLVGTYFGVLGI